MSDFEGEDVTAEDVIELYSTLLERGIQLWLDGGWGIDALLQRQTRSHTDLDAIVAFDQLPALGRLLYERPTRTTWMSTTR